MSGPSNDRDPIISREDIDILRRMGYNQTEIANMVGTTRQNISYIKRHLGRQDHTDFWKSPREAVRDHFPWKTVGHPFTDSPLDGLLRDHAEYQATGGEGMSEDKLRRLLSFYRKLRDEDLVVEFHPSIPPTEHERYDGESRRDVPLSDYNKHGGYAYRPRTPVDGELIIRVNELARLTSTGKVIWRFPRRLPVVD